MFYDSIGERMMQDETMVPPRWHYCNDNKDDEGWGTPADSQCVDPRVLIIAKQWHLGTHQSNKNLKALFSCTMNDLWNVNKINQKLNQVN